MSEKKLIIKVNGIAICEMEYRADESDMIEQLADRINDMCLDAFDRGKASA